MMNTIVLWFTGLSGSGKTTIANILQEELKKLEKHIMVVDGDTIRSTLHRNLDFTPENIKENNRRIAMICHKNLGKYDFILVSAISPFRESRNFARDLLSSHFIEVYVKADIKECIQRDVKGLYKKALAGLIDNFIGISPQTPYEAPINPEVKIDTEKQEPLASAKRILQYISKEFKENEIKK